MKLTSKLVVAMVAMVMTLMVCGGAYAQEFRGTISGKVSDATGAVIPGVNITVRETQSGTLSRTKTDAAGQYVVPFLLPGQYTVTAERQGFQKTEQQNITLQSQEHPVVNLTLQVGEATQTVTVTTAPPLLDTTNASVGQVISTKEVEDLPINGRTPTTLTELSVGVITTAAPQIVHPFDNNAGNSWSIGGTPNQQSEVLLDGSPDLTLLGALAYAPTEDSVKEVSVRPFDTDASFGHTIGGVINQVTKSGTNDLHGSVYEFSQISNLDANTYFNDRAGKPLPVTHYNQYGLTVGGPVWLPKIYNGRNKLFFFFAFEGLKDSTPATTTLSVPTAAERTGDFSQLLTAGCAGYTVNSAGVAMCPDGKTVDPNQLFNPFNATLVNGKVVRQAIPNNQLTAAGPLSAVALAYLKLEPLPNTTAGVKADGLKNYISNAPSIDTYNNEFGRLDYNLSSRDHLFFDYRHNNRTQTKNDYFGNGITGTTLLRENWGATLDNVFTLNPTTIFDTRFNWTYFNEVHGSPDQAYSPTSVGMPAGLTSASELTQLPCIRFSTSSSVSCGSSTNFQTLGDTGSALDPTTSYQAFVDMVKVLGNHTLKVGFDGRQYRMSIQNFGASSGNFMISPSFVTSGSGGVTKGANQKVGGYLADLLFGLPNAGEYTLAARSDYHQYYIGVFVQDDWRVNDRLTLNLGVRLDADTPYREKLGRTVNGFNPQAVNSASQAAAAAFTPQTVTQNGSSYTVSTLNTLGGLTFPNVANGTVYNTANNFFFSPRFGFSFAATPKTVVRGGFGIFVQPETLASIGSTGVVSSGAINNQEGFSATTPYVSTTDNGLTPANSLTNPFPDGIQQPVGSSQGASTFLGQSISFLAPVEHDPYSERWDIGAEHSLTPNTMVEVLYVGNHALHLPVASQDLNAVPTQYLSHTPYLDLNRSQAYSTNVPNPYAGLLPGTKYNSSTTSFGSLLHPYPQFGTNSVTIQNQTIGQSWFNSLILHYQQRMTHGLTLTANYSFSKLLEDDSFLNQSDPTPTERVSPFDHTHHFTVGGSYNLPFGRGKLVSFGGSRLWDEVFGGFVINSVYQFQTGAPLELTSDIPLAPGVTVNDIKIQPRNTGTDTGPGGRSLDPALFVTGTDQTCPATGACDGSQFINAQYSNHYRTLPDTLSRVRTDGFNNLDASILKNFHFTERSYLQLRFETFNTLNHPIFAAPTVSDATSSTFGEITSTYKNSQPRQVQLGARIVF